jgi:hypothetical protein
MSITINSRGENNAYDEKNIRQPFISIDNFESKTFTYNGNNYIFFDLNNYNNIDFECDGYEIMDVICLKNKTNKYVLFSDKNHNICIQLNNFECFSILYHYYGYKWGPCRSYNNAPLWDVINITNYDFEDDYIENNLFVPF